MKNNAGAWIWPTQDGLGNVRQEVSDGLAVNGARSYAPFLTPFDEQGNFGMPFTATGEMTDASGLMYLRNRYMRPSLGQFVSLDPLETPNRYAYVSGNPVNFTDPSGLCETFAMACGAAIASPFDLIFGDIPAYGALIVCAGLALAGSLVAGVIASNAVNNPTIVGVPSGTGAPGGMPPSNHLSTLEFLSAIEDAQEIQEKQQELAEICNSGFCTDTLRYLINSLTGGNVYAQSNADTAEKEKEDRGCNIEVRGNIVNRQPFNYSGMFHLYIIFTDENGIEYIFRGGPEWPTGQSRCPNVTGSRGAVTVLSQPYMPNGEDWNPSAPRKSVLKGKGACDKLVSLNAEVMRINSKCVEYQGIGPNSNTVVSTMLSKCGIEPKSPVSTFLTPGWRNRDLN